jgi:hypothetical protein
MNLSLNCSIRGCPRFVEVELRDLDGREISADSGFVLCRECHGKIWNSTAIVIQKAGAWVAPDNYVKLAVAFNGLFRKRRGVSWLFGPNPVGQAPGLPSERGN